MELIQALIGLCTALPAIIGLINRVALTLHRRSNGDVLAFVKSLTDAYDLLDKADTVDEKTQAAKALSDLVHSLKR